MPDAAAARGLGETLGDAARAVQRALTAAGVEDEGRDARLLVAAAAGVDTAAIIARPERRLATDEQARLEAMVARRCAASPSRAFSANGSSTAAAALSQATLDPRTDSETLIEARSASRRRELARADESAFDLHRDWMLMMTASRASMANGWGTDISDAPWKTAARTTNRRVAQRVTRGADARMASPAPAISSSQAPKSERDTPGLRGARIAPLRP